MFRQTDPKIIGPGVWHMLHTEAINSTTEDTKNHFEKTVLNLELTFPCEKCKSHLSAFIKKYPLRDYRNDFFLWTWILHNAVNKHLNKYQPSLEEARAAYQIEFRCTSCGEASATLPPSIPYILDGFKSGELTGRPL